MYARRREASGTSLDQIAVVLNDKENGSSVAGSGLPV